MQWIILKLIVCYQKVSWLWPKACRFYPSCSCYANQCVKQHGALKGSWLTIVRLLKCHPLNAGGFDYPPQAH